MMDSGAGLLPSLLRWITGAGRANDNAGATAAAVGGISSPMAPLTPIAAGSDAAIGPDGIRNPLSGPEQPGARLDALGMPLTPGQMQPIAAGYTNPLPDPSTMNSDSSWGDIGSAIGGLGKALGGASGGGPSNTPGGGPYQPPQPVPPQGGGGPNPGMLQSTNMGMNPLLLAFLKARLANMGGGLG